ncbi:MAG: lipopolysaccharide transport periplasmic protein LptA [Gammaproteobacteria bacterium]|nr:MAG: lipopolysaccharide transport periplasmic protein LptA [Gammaproteobacteria bacterium]
MSPDAPKIPLWLLPALLLASSPLFALSSDREQPVHIEADRLVLDEPHGTVTYSGHTRLTQGSIRLEADQVVVHAPRRRFSRAVATGSPARFSQLTDDGHKIRARARHMEYLAAKQRLILQGEAELWQDDNLLKGPRIVYDMADNRVEARGGDQTQTTGQERVRIILQPETLDKDKEKSGGGSP